MTAAALSIYIAARTEALLRFTKEMTQIYEEPSAAHRKIRTAALHL
jgi:hypothetical protein